MKNNTSLLGYKLGRGLSGFASESYIKPKKLDSLMHMLEGILIGQELDTLQEAYNVICGNNDEYDEENYSLVEAEMKKVIGVKELCEKRRQQWLDAKEQSVFYKSCLERFIDKNKAYSMIYDEVKKQGNPFLEFEFLKIAHDCGFDDDIYTLGDYWFGDKHILMDPDYKKAMECYGDISNHTGRRFLNMASILYNELADKNTMMDGVEAVRYYKENISDKIYYYDVGNLRFFITDLGNNDYIHEWVW